MITKLLALVTAAALALGTMAVSIAAQAAPICEDERTVAPGSIYTGTRKSDEECAAPE